MPLNFEFKARCNNILKAEQVLLQQQPRYAGEDHQTDTYFNVPHGRMKLREGNIENALIHYVRQNTAGAKQSEVLLYHHQPDPALKQILTAANGIRVVVEKTRKIYFIRNVKFHFDTVPSLGTFVEVEAIDTDGSITLGTLKEQCRSYARLLDVKDEDYITGSYSDMLMEKKSSSLSA